VNPDAVRKAVRDLLFAVGDDPDRVELRETPRRVAESYAELLSGYSVDAAALLHRLPGDGVVEGEAVAVSRLAFRSMCEHHLLPFRGVAHVVYAPSEAVAGFGSFARALDALAARLQVQERLTGQFADAVESGLGARGVVVVIEASHGCLSDRGARQADARAVTMASRGIYLDAGRRSEALRLIPTHDAGHASDERTVDRNASGGHARRVRRVRAARR
jgi:GTP cyclohydrolase IA